MKAIVFGANGYLGSAILEELTKSSFDVTTSSRSSGKTEFQTHNGFDAIIASGKKFNACIWAQGQNASDILGTSENFDAIFDANIVFIIKSLRALIENNLLAPQARLVVLSSVWQSLSRTNKFSYSVSKAAVEGLVNSFIADYSAQGYAMNAVLPGIVDSPMTRANLSENQIKKIENETPSQYLVSASNVAKVVSWLSSPDSAGVNGQFIRVDNGWSHIRAI
jgi:3-oxoacyl-[acyl-carrier protein] reductase